MCHGIFIHSFSATHCFDSSSYEVRSTCNCIPRTFGHQAHQHNQWQMQVRQSKALSLENLQMETLEPAWLNAWNWFGYHRSLFGSRCKWHTYLGAKATRGNRGKPALVVVGTVGAPIQKYLNASIQKHCDRWQEWRSKWIFQFQGSVRWPFTTHLPPRFSAL